MDDIDATTSLLATIGAVTGLLASILLLVQSFRVPEKAMRMRVLAGFFLAVAAAAWFVLRAP
jgi:phosphoglycerol transferase MdoB-like AlkP superfamily enzyme